MFQIPGQNSRQYGRALRPMEQTIPILQVLVANLRVREAELGIMLLEHGTRFGVAIHPLIRQLYFRPDCERREEGDVR